jgi:hypothetical protein
MALNKARITPVLQDGRSTAGRRVTLKIACNAYFGVRVRTWSRMGER